MSRALIALLVILLLVIVGLVVLSRGHGPVPTHRIEKTVTLGGDGAQ